MTAIAGCGGGGGENDDGTPDGDGAAQVDYDEWLTSPVAAPNYDGNVVDMTGQSEVEVECGEPLQAGQFVFDPAAIRIDAGTTVTWVWVGDIGHSVTAEDGAEFDSTVLQGDGTTWDYTFEEPGAVTYYCTPHLSVGQKGAVIVE